MLSAILSLAGPAILGPAGMNLVASPMIASAIGGGLGSLLQGGDTKDVLTKAREIYGVSPLSAKSARAIQNLDNKRLQTALIIFSILGAVPLPGFWLADMAIASYYFNKVWKDASRGGWERVQSDDLFNAFLSTGFGMLFSRAPTEINNALTKFYSGTRLVPLSTSLEARIAGSKVVDESWHTNKGWSTNSR